MCVIHANHSLKSPYDRSASPQILKWCSNRPPFSLQPCLGSPGAPAEPSLQSSTGGPSAQKGLASTLNEALSDCTELCCPIVAAAQEAVSARHLQRVLEHLTEVQQRQVQKCDNKPLSRAPSEQRHRLNDPSPRHSRTTNRVLSVGEGVGLAAIVKQVSMSNQSSVTHSKEE